MKILYGLPSEGMGHATRSRIIIEHLLKKHDVRIVTSDRAFTLMKQHFPNNVHKIRGFHLAYSNGQVSKRKTFTHILKNAPSDIIENFRKYGEIHKQFNPDLVISDFESFTQFFAKIYKKPLMSIDNIQVIDRCKLDIHIPSKERTNYSIARNIVKSKVPFANYYLITSFFKAEVLKENTTVIPSILRNEILNTEPTVKNHIIVYQTSSSQKNIVEILQGVSHEHFLVYGFNRNETLKNVTFKTFSESGFINDLATSKAVITNGGFSLISEAVYLKKPVYCFPIKNQFEQYINAAYIETLGFGRNFQDLGTDTIKAFLYDIDIFQKNIYSYSQNGNRQTFETVDRLIEELAKSTDQRP